MTLVVTHTEGFLGCFTMNPDGSMKQRALIDTGDEQVSPQELAETGMVLAETYGWSLVPVVNGVKKPTALKKPEPVKALPAKKRQTRASRGPNREYPPTDMKAAMILECLAEYPGSTLKEALAHMNQPTDDRAGGNWYHVFRVLRDEGKISSVGGGKGSSHDPARFSLVK